VPVDGGGPLPPLKAWPKSNFQFTNHITVRSHHVEYSEIQSAGIEPLGKKAGQGHAHQNPVGPFDRGNSGPGLQFDPRRRPPQSGVVYRQYGPALGQPVAAVAVDDRHTPGLFRIGPGSGRIGEYKKVGQGGNKDLDLYPGPIGNIRGGGPWDGQFGGTRKEDQRTNSCLTTSTIR